MSEELKKIFEELKKIRVEKKKTLKQISQSTRIHLKYLESLEEGNLLEIPEIYDKLFFKSYIKILDVAENDYYEKFLEYRKTIRDDRTAILDMTQTDSEVSSEFNYKNLLYFVPIILAVLVIWFLISNTLMIDNGKDSVQEINIQEVAAKMQSAIDSAKTAKIESNKTSDSTKTTLPLVLNINAIEETWFRIVIDESDTNEYLLKKGQKISFTSQNSFDFLIGKANGLKMDFNNNAYGPFGDNDQVVKYMRIDSSGISAKIIGYPLNKVKELNAQD